AVTLVGAAFHGCRFAVAFAPPALPLAELAFVAVPPDEPEDPDELLELDDPQAASTTANNNAANIADNFAIRDPRRMRSSSLTGWLISRLSPLVVMVMVCQPHPATSACGGCGAADQSVAEPAREEA